MKTQESRAKRRDVFGRNPRAAVAAEPGRHGIDGYAVRHGVSQPLLAGGHESQPTSILGKPNGCPVDRHLNEGINTHGASAHDTGFG
jgi:hypothetical protein